MINKAGARKRGGVACVGASQCPTLIENLGTQCKGLFAATTADGLGNAEAILYRAFLHIRAVHRGHPDEPMRGRLQGGKPICCDGNKDVCGSF